MTKVDIGDDGFEVDAKVIAQALDLDPAAVPAMMKAGEITGICERGEGPDAGRYRLTFRFKDRNLRLVVAADGGIIESAND